MKEERLHKFLAGAGLGSRRAAEGLVQSGRVRVNGRVVTELGTKVDPDKARIEVDGRRVVRQPYIYLVVHKPRGYVCTLRDPEGRQTVAELVAGVGSRVVPVGRLDYASSGVLLMTNDGDFMATLLHPGGGAAKVYHAKVRGMVDERGLERWRRSIDIDGRHTRPAQVRVLEIIEDKTWLEIVLHEGRNRQIRRLGDAAGYPVSRLIRVEYAGITVDDVTPGKWRHLTKDELLDLRRRFGVPKRMPSSMPSKESSTPGLRTRTAKASRSQPFSPKALRSQPVAAGSKGNRHVEQSTTGRAKARPMATGRAKAGPMATGRAKARPMAAEPRKRGARPGR